MSGHEVRVLVRQVVLDSAVAHAAGVPMASLRDAIADAIRQQVPAWHTARGESHAASNVRHSPAALATASAIAGALWHHPGVVQACSEPRADPGPSANPGVTGGHRGAV